ncbi:metal ABC transporter permease [Actinomadura oligospora]|uniref:metal ABC transporter permease n=1 Tax=Actinomadura oligospora TaxID=111804 RepID=UPI00047A60D6|nr:metal ABC transporter permease [Actinomadura oligospora]
MTALQRATVEALLVGAAGGLISVQLLLRRLAFFTLAMTHATFPGVVLAALLGADLYLGGAAFGVLLVLAIAWLTRRPGHDSSTAIGIVLSGGFALGVVLLSARDGFTKDPSAYTVGQILVVDSRDLTASALVAALVLVLTDAAGRQLTFQAFDPDAYAAAGFRAARTDVLFLAAVQAVILIAVPAVGTILAVALLVGPAATARLWTARLPLMTCLACVLGAASGLAGITLSAHHDIAAGGAITLATGALFTISLLLRRTTA